MVIPTRLSLYCALIASSRASPTSQTPFWVFSPTAKPHQLPRIDHLSASTLSPPHFGPSLACVQKGRYRVTVPGGRSDAPSWGRRQSCRPGVGSDNGSNLSRHRMRTNCRCVLCIDAKPELFQLFAVDGVGAFRVRAARRGGEDLRRPELPHSM